jgi:predicted phosphoadenosine phosphosulfate sulfurtransferase
MVHKRIHEYVKDWEAKCYTSGIPDEAPLEISDKVPSYKRIAMCILKNDMHLKGLGYEGFNSKYYSILKRIEISARKTNKQLKLF